MTEENHAKTDSMTCVLVHVTSQYMWDKKLNAEQSPSLS